MAGFGSLKWGNSPWGSEGDGNVTTSSPPTTLPSNDSSFGESAGFAAGSNSVFLIANEKGSGVIDFTRLDHLDFSGIKLKSIRRLIFE